MFLVLVKLVFIVIVSCSRIRLLILPSFLLLISLASFHPFSWHLLVSTSIDRLFFVC